MANIFTKGLDKNDQKEGLFKRLENIKDKNKELLNAFSAANKVSKDAKNESDSSYDSRYAFYREIYNNQDNNDFKIVINERTCDSKNAKKNWMEATTRKTTKSETKELYNELIQKDTDALEREKNDESNKIDNVRKFNILSILDNVGSIFTGAYLHYKNLLKETMFARSIAEKTKLRRGRSDEIENRKKKNRT